MDECIFACHWIEMQGNSWTDSCDCMQIWQIFVFPTWICCRHECEENNTVKCASNACQYMANK